MSDAHTELPWEVIDGVIQPVDPKVLDGDNICRCSCPVDAAFIVRAANCHEELLAAAVYVTEYARISRTGRMLSGDGFAMLEAAIAKATATTPSEV